MKKLFISILVICLLLSGNAYADHQTDHWVNLICKYSDGSGNFEIKFDKKTLKEFRPKFNIKIRKYEIVEKNNSEITAIWQGDDNDRQVYVISRTTGNWIHLLQIIDLTDPADTYGTYQNSSGFCKTQTQAF